MDFFDAYLAKAIFGPQKFEGQIKEKVNKPLESNFEAHNEKSGIVENHNLGQREIEPMNQNPLFFNRNKMRLHIKIKAALVKLNYQKTKFNRDQILKIRQEKLQKFRIDYIPLCSDEDWEAMSDFYSKNSGG